MSSIHAPPYEPRWDLDLERGRVKEELARRLLTNDDDRLTVEVKGDFRAIDTGNHFVELSARGRPSGIMVTESDYWAVALESGAVVMVPVERMRELVAEALAEGRTVRMPNGSHPKEGALVPLSWLLGAKPLLRRP
jgi:hypothetical protein